MISGRRSIGVFSGVLVCAVALVATPAISCSIPVFRYALERWPADLFVADAQVPSSVGADGRRAINWLEDQAQPNGGPLNLTVVRAATTEEGTAAEQALVSLSAPSHGRDPSMLWEGTAEQAQAALTAGPWRDDLVRRLASGDSVVWLVLEGSDPASAKKAADLLTDELPQFAEDTPLPRGIGLPGSELMTGIPLEVRFSVLKVPSDADGEKLLRATLLAGRASTFAADTAIDSDAALVVPVFGRGRAAAVLPAATLSLDAIAELTGFLCGACSCQVKQLNPGFDLLLPVDWEMVLFGEGLAALPPEAAEPASSSEAELVPIPAGRSRNARRVQGTTP